MFQNSLVAVVGMARVLVGTSPQVPDHRAFKGSQRLLPNLLREGSSGRD
jgi:hypothetical protein